MAAAEIAALVQLALAIVVVEEDVGGAVVVEVGAVVEVGEAEGLFEQPARATAPRVADSRILARTFRMLVLPLENC